MKLETIWSLIRIVLGSIFLWAFFDKLFGLGFATLPEKSWLSGVSPTAGFLAFGTKGTFAFFFHLLSGNIVVDILFMLGLFGIGMSLLLGIGMKIAGYSGALFVSLLYLALTPPANNPLLDEHIVYLLVFLAFATGETGHRFSIYQWWRKTTLVKRYQFLL